MAQIVVYYGGGKWVNWASNLEHQLPIYMGGIMVYYGGGKWVALASNLEH